MANYLYDASIPIISSLQQVLPDASEPMTLISRVFDPKYAFLYYAPIAFLLDKRLGKQLILVVVLAEWLNQILKWFLYGHRPYWYVHEASKLSGSNLEGTPIQQFPPTCELGPGHPSGHAMITAAVWHVLIDYAQAKWTSFKQVKNIHRREETLFKTFYLALIVLVSLSRVYLACHFPHQCLVGGFLGWLLARFVVKQWSDWNLDENVSTPYYLLALSPLLFTSALSTYSLLLLIDIDPNWTIKLATEHCVKREYLHMDTAPLFSLMRYSGFLFGIGLGLLNPLGDQIGAKIKDLLILKFASLSRSNSEENLSVAANTNSTPYAATAGKPKIANQYPLSANYLYWLSIRLVCALILARFIDNLSLFVSPTNSQYYYSSGLIGYATFAFAIVNI